MAGETANYFWDKTRDLPDQTGFNELFPELLKWDGKLPKQALYQTEPRPDKKETIWLKIVGLDRMHSKRKLSKQYYTQGMMKMQSKNPNNFRIKRCEKTAMGSIPRYTYIIADIRPCLQYV